MKSLSLGTYFAFLSAGVLVTSIAVATRPFNLSAIASGGLGVAAVILATGFAIVLLRTRLNLLLGGFVGLLAGCLFALILILISNASLFSGSPAYAFVRLALPVLLAYVGMVIGISKSEGFFSTAPLSPGTELQACNSKLLDTSVLIDGRITDIVECGFLEGPLVVPRFVLNELQLVADSADAARRARGRRGLDVVQHLQSVPDLKVEVAQQDFPAIREVDLKLIELAKSQKAQIVTNDFNLNKLARVQGVKVLNINQLASCLKPIVLPGELMRVFILKEGKEHNQGIAYLDDGTMVVVDNARRFISKNIDVVVTSVLQTTAGKMIFGRYDDRGQSENRQAAG